MDYEQFKGKSMNFLSWDNLSRRLSGGVGVGLRFKALKRHPSPKSSPQGRGLFNVLKPLNQNGLGVF